MFVLHLLCSNAMEPKGRNTIVKERSCNYAKNQIYDCKVVKIRWKMNDLGPIIYEISQCLLFTLFPFTMNAGQPMIAMKNYIMEKCVFVKLLTSQNHTRKYDQNTLPPPVLFEIFFQSVSLTNVNYIISRHFSIYYGIFYNFYFLLFQNSLRSVNQYRSLNTVSRHHLYIQ